MVADPSMSSMHTWLELGRDLQYAPDVFVPAYLKQLVAQPAGGCGRPTVAVPCPSPAVARRAAPCGHPGTLQAVRWQSLRLGEHLMPLKLPPDTRPVRHKQLAGRWLTAGGPTRATSVRGTSLRHHLWRESDVLRELNGQTQSVQASINAMLG